MSIEKKIKVLMFSNIFGGKNTFIHNELVNLKDKCEIKYIAIEEIENRSLKIEFDNFKIIPFSENRLQKKIKWWLWRQDIYLSFKNKDFAKKIRKEVNFFKPDVIHLQFGYEALKFLDNYYNPDIPYIIHFHGYDASAMFRKKAYVKKLKYFLSLNNVHQIYVSNFIKKRFIKYNLDVSRGNIIKCGIDLSKFKQKEIQNTKDRNDWVFTQVSSQVEKKGIPYAIKGFYNFINNHKNINCKFFITGFPTEENKTLVEKYKLTDQIIFTGLLSHKQVEELLCKTDVFIHCSITSEEGDEEGIPTAIMEAMAMRIPVLSTFHSGIPELIKNNVHGVLVEEKNADQISEALEKLTKMGSIQEDMHDYLVKNKYDLNSHIYEIESLYKNLSRI
jgi:colanic acid/amylovoran biosynthesis glycosyltransferase